MARSFLVPFRRLLRLAGSRWRYSTPPPHGFWSLLLMNLWLNWMHEWTPFYNCEMTEETPPPRVPLLLFMNALSRKPCCNSEVTVWFLSVYNFQFSYPGKPCSVNSWFPRINLSMATYLPIRFLETAHISQYGSKFMHPKLGLVQVRHLEADTNLL
jgi:hypothetical protein